ncbi:translation initiation factor IF-2-like [Oenanthe melanoleuca]|uniref:translation initiation factor IF-2-like n=1 Tax=Oenanthe melanoleuca TaxID=2939378 RepID=UPI0024C1E5E4|nr:translation initiation factor IF-2-like [Oenanthe melanoleuca]
MSGRQLEAAAQPAGCSTAPARGPEPRARQPSGAQRPRTKNGEQLPRPRRCARGSLGPRAGRGPRHHRPGTRASPAGPGPGRFEHGPSAPPPSALPPQGPRRSGAPEGPEPAERSGVSPHLPPPGPLGGSLGSRPPAPPRPPQLPEPAGPGGTHGPERSRSRRGQDWEVPPGSPRAAPPCDSSCRGPMGRPLSRTSANQRCRGRGSRCLRGGRPPGRLLWSLRRGAAARARGRTRIRFPMPGVLRAGLGGDPGSPGPCELSLLGAGGTGWASRSLPPQTAESVQRPQRYRWPRDSGAAALPPGTRSAAGPRPIKRRCRPALRPSRRQQRDPALRPMAPGVTGVWEPLGPGCGGGPALPSQDANIPGRGRDQALLWAFTSQPCAPVSAFGGRAELQKQRGLWMITG